MSDQDREDDEFQYDESGDDTDGVGNDPEPETAGGASDASGASEDAGAGEHETKLCRYCISEIDALATRCCRCSGDLRFIEGTDIKQNWNMLFFCVAIFIACIWLPIERHDGHFLYPSHSFSGGLLAIFAGFGMLASYGNILQRKAIYWPVLFMAFDGLYVGISRYIGAFGQLPEKTVPKDYITMGGPALPIILFCSLLTLWTFMKGVASGRAKDKAAKEAARRR